MIKRLYRKFLIWHYGKFKDRITRCNHCKFRVWKNEPDAYSKMIRHNLYDCKKLSPKEQLDYLNEKLWEVQNRLIQSLIDAQDDNPYNPYGW